LSELQLLGLGLSSANWQALL